MSELDPAQSTFMVGEKVKRSMVEHEVLTTFAEVAAPTILFLAGKISKRPLLEKMGEVLGLAVFAHLGNKHIDRNVDWVDF